MASSDASDGHLPHGVSDKLLIATLLDVEHPLGRLHAQLLSLFEARMQQLPGQATDWVLAFPVVCFSYLA